MIDRFLNLDYNHYANNPVGVVSTTRCLGRGRGLRPYRPRPLKRNHPLTTLPSTAVSAVAYLRTLGSPPPSRSFAIALVSVFCYESSLNPTAENNSGTDAGGVINPKGAYGIAQWNGIRQQRLWGYVLAHGGSVSSLDTQLAFALNEIANFFPAVWTLVNSDESYTTIIPVIVAQYENPANHAAETNGALAYAALLNAEVPIAAPAPATPATTPATSPAPQSGTTTTTPPVPSGPAVSPPATGFEMPPALTAALGQLVVAAAQWLLTTIIQAHTTTTTPAATTTPAPAKTTTPTAATTAAPDLSSVLSSLITPLAQALAAELAKVSAAAPPSPPQA